MDNNSGLEDRLQLELGKENLVFVPSDKNLGFAGGNNLGIQVATGDFILLLNNDTVVNPDFLRPMLDVFEKYPKAGAVSPKIKYFDQPNTIQYAGFTPMNPFTLRMKAVGSKQPDNGAYNSLTKTAFAHGCAMMVSKAVINCVGAMPEDYFLYYEEHDWSAQIKRAGFEIYYQPHAVVYHKESMSVKKNSPLKTYFINRNRILYMKRNLGFIQKLLSTIYLLMVSVPKNLAKFLVKGQREHFLAYTDALIWNLTHKTKTKWNF